MSKLFHLFIGNKNYSSWSLVAWLCLKSAGIKFDETKILLGIKGSKKKILEYSPSGHLPALKIGELLIHDSLAIAEYINELYPNILYPENTENRAVCRSIISELHSGFNNFRAEAPMNIRNNYQNILFSENASYEINRIISLFLSLFDSSNGPFLFGKWSFADIFYSPIVIRFINYKLEHPKKLNQYFENVLENKHLQQWIANAKDEVETIEIIDKLEKSRI